MGSRSSSPCGLGQDTSSYKRLVFFPHVLGMFHCPLRVIVKNKGLMNSNYETLNRYLIQTSQQSFPMSTGCPAAEVPPTPIQAQRLEDKRTCRGSGKTLNDHLAPPRGPLCVVLGEQEACVGMEGSEHDHWLCRGGQTLPRPQKGGGYAKLGLPLWLRLQRIFLQCKRHRFLGS